MMKAKIVFIERKYWKRDGWAFSIENVFRQIAEKLSVGRFETEFVKIPYGNSFIEIIKNLIFFTKPTADIYHITGQIHYLGLVLPPRKTVLTIHDIGFLHVSKGIRRVVLKKLFLDLPVKRLKYLTAVSETTKNEILFHTNCPPAKITVIENPLQENFSQPAKKEFNTICPTILQIGITPNKNIPMLLTALQGIECRLKIIGKPDDLLRSKLEKSGINYEIAFGLDDVAMKNEYEKADLVTFCSTFEGFGLPIIEAQSMERPVITSNLSPMSEVSGGAAHLVDPHVVESIRRGILKIISDKKYRKTLVENGKENIKRFGSKQIAERYEKLYAQVLDEN